MEPVDAAKPASKNNSVSTMISNPKVFDCCICFHLLSIPIFQCDNGHIVCSTCCSKLGNKCDKCSNCISLKRCRAFENLLQYIKMPCPNEKYGCRETIDYTQKTKHEEECIYVPCYCPISGCDFVASSEVLSNHFSNKHEDSQIKFSYGQSFVVSLKSDDDAIVLHEKYDGKLFILNNSTMFLGNAVNICCFGPNASESKCSYRIMSRSQRCKLKLHSFVTNVQQVTSGTLSLEFLMIPNGTSEPLKLEICIQQQQQQQQQQQPSLIPLSGVGKLEICITCTNPVMQIYVKDLNGLLFALNVKSLDTIFSVKEQIFDKKTYPVQDQRLIFQGRQLHDSTTVADNNIQKASTLHLVLRLLGD